MTTLRTLIIAAAFLLATLLPRAAEAIVYINIESPSGKKIPIALQETVFMKAPTEAEKAAYAYVKAEMTDALLGDMEFAGLFEVISQSAHIDEGMGLTSDQTDFSKWRGAGAELVIKSGISIDSGTLTVELRLFDTVREIQLVGKRYETEVSNPRALAHKFMDDTYLKLTGKTGIFSTKITFSSTRTGNKEIYISDYDGKNVNQVTQNGSINLHPRLSHDGRHILYTSYMKGQSAVYRQELSSGKVWPVTEYKGITIGGRWSPDDKHISLAYQGPKSTEIGIIATSNWGLKQLTDNYSIDVSPAWSPDGKTIAYSSDMAGNPHIYVIDSKGGKPRRITFEGIFLSTPEYSPDGSLIAYARMDLGKFNIWVMSANGGNQSQLTFSGNNTEPSWSPDGRYIVFSRKSEGGDVSLYMIRKDGTGIRRLDIGPGNESLPSWGPAFSAP